MKKDLLLALRSGEELTLRQQTLLALQLSIPAILAQVSSIAMQYIDSSMVGHLGREASAAIGLVASSTWLLGGLCRALTVGFCVQTAQRIGAGEEKDARNLVRQSLVLASPSDWYWRWGAAPCPAVPPAGWVRRRASGKVRPCIS